MMTSNPWNGLIDHFRSGKESLHSLDNELIALPQVLSILEKVGSPRSRGKILDYGCGSGGFCRTLHRLGHSVVGIDSSERMIASARIDSDGGITFHHGTSADLPLNSEFDIITSIMVFQFIVDLADTIADLAKHQRVDGHLIFAVHNPEYVESCIKEHSELFLNFESGVPGTGEIYMGGIRIPIYIRSVAAYDAILVGSGLYQRETLPTFPPFTEEFLRRFPLTPAADVSKFLILSYRRK